MSVRKSGNPDSAMTLAILFLFENTPFWSNSIFTAHKQSCGKVMFLHLSVTHSVSWGGGACLVKEVMHGKWGVYGEGGHALQGSVHGKGGACMQDKRPLKRAVRILLEYILAFNENIDMLGLNGPLELWLFES